MAHPLLSDPFVAAQVDDAVAPFAPRLPPDELAWLRDQLAVLLQTDSEAANLLRGAHPRKMTQGALAGGGQADVDPAVGHGSS